MEIARFIPAAANGRRSIIGLVAAGAMLAVPAHAFAESAPAAAPTASSFSWNVQIADDFVGGISPDLPSAIALAKTGETLTPDEADYVVKVLTDEATEAGVSLVAIAPAPEAAPAPVTPAIVEMPSTDDGQ